VPLFLKAAETKLIFGAVFFKSGEEKNENNSISFNSKMTYELLHKSIIKPDTVDIVSFEEIRPNGRNYVMHLRMIEKEIEGQKVPRVPVKLIPYDTYSAYDTFITRGLKFDPETREPLNANFFKRIQLYKEALDTFGSEFEPSVEELNRLMNKYLQGESLDERETLYLRSYLNADNSSAIKEFDGDVRVMAKTALKQKGEGSWLLRRSSIKNSSLIKVKVLSCFDKNEYHHYPFFHVSGLGYYSTNDFDKNEMPGLPEPIGSIPNFSNPNTQLYPCFFDLLVAMQKLFNFSFSMYCT
jgi:hypothetical protein